MSTMMGATPPPAMANPAMTGGNASVMALATMGLSSNKYILGLMILLINLGARYIGNELNEFSHKVLNHKFARRFLIFLVIWMGCRDLVVSLIITTCFILLSNTLLNEQSTYCILPIDNPSPVSKEEYDVAKQMVQKYEASHPPMPVAVGMPGNSSNTNTPTPSNNTNLSNTNLSNTNLSNMQSSLPINNNVVSNFVSK
jgi:hypothetical protein